MGQSKARAARISVYDLHPDLLPSPGRYDVVFFSGVLYHLKHPLLGLERVKSVCNPGGIAVVEGHVLEYAGLPSSATSFGEKPPIMFFLPGSELNDDPTNWFAMSKDAYEAMLRTAGFFNCRAIASISGFGRMVWHCAC